MAVTASLVGFEQTGTSVTFGTVAGDTAILIACLDTSGDNNTLSCTWDTGLGANQAMTRLGSVLGADGNKITFFGLVNPSIVVNASVVITGWSGSGVLANNFLSFQGTLTTTTAACFTNLASNTGTSNTPSVTVTSAVGNLVAAAFEAANPGVASTNGTEWFPSSNGGTGSYATGASSVTLTATIGGSPTWAAIGVNVVQGVAAGTPKALYDWPNPRRQIIRRQDWQKSFQLPLQQVLPPRQTEWPVPKKWPYRAVGHIDPLKVSLLSGYKPFNQTEWPLPTRAKPPLIQDWNQTGQALATAVPLIRNPAFNDWFNPWGPLRRVEDYQASYVSIATIPPPDLTAQTRQLDWPNPTLRKPPVVVDWQQSSTWLLSQPLPELPTGRQLDWPLPIRSRLPVVQDWLNATYLFQPALLSFDWPNPSRGPRRNPPDWVTGSTMQLTAPLPTLTSGRQRDWPLPTRARAPVVRDWVVGSTRTVTAPPPVMPMARPRDWPNPRGAKPNQGLGRINNTVGFSLVPPQAPTETLVNLSGRVRFLENEVGRVRWLKRLKS